MAIAFSELSNREAYLMRTDRYGPKIQVVASKVVSIPTSKHCRGYRLLCPSIQLYNRGFRTLPTEAEYQMLEIGSQSELN